MSKSRNYKAAQYFFFAFIVSNLCLATGVIVYSSFLAWVYSDDTRRASYNFDTTPKFYVVAYAVISALGCALFIISFIALVAFFFIKNLHSKLNMAYLYVSLPLLIGMFLTPLVVMAVMSHADGLYVWWMIWMALAICLAVVSIYLIKKTSYQSEVVKHDYEPKEGDIVYNNP